MNTLTQGPQQKKAATTKTWARRDYRANTLAIRKFYVHHFMYYSVYVLLFSRVIFTFVIYFSCLILYYYCRIVLMISAALFTLYVFVPPKWIHRFDFAGKKILWKIHCKWTVWALKMLANEFHQRKKIIFGTSKKLARGKDMNFKWKESMVNNVPWWLPKLWVLVNNERTSAQDDYRCWVGSAWISIIFTNKKKNKHDCATRENVVDTNRSL